MADPLLKLGTRGSPLALAQAHETRDRLLAAHAWPTDAVKIEVFSTRGDEILSKALTEIGGKGLFTQELEAALHSGAIDIAVHSTKDMPTDLPDGLVLQHFLPREDPRDVFIGRHGESLDDLREGAVVGTASLRRAALVKRQRPDVKTEVLRGNVQTRLKKLHDGVVDATLLALAGLNRLEMDIPGAIVLDPERFPPALAQGAIGIESRANDGRVHDLLAAIDDQETAITVQTERAFLNALDGSCKTPIAGNASRNGDDITISGIVLKEDGSAFHEITDAGPAEQAEAIGRRAGANLKVKAGPRFLPHW
ncbi:MAG: hydroxymethylbilane synthase [Pseudomonadota bacterium]